VSNCWRLAIDLKKFKRSISKLIKANSAKAKSRSVVISGMISRTKNGGLEIEKLAINR
jgi:hypothetical protein